MKCNDCDYAADYIDDSEVDKKPCDITDEVHEAEFDCNCEVQRRMYDKRNHLIMEYEAIKDKATLSSTCIICGKTVDGEYGTTKVCYMCKNAIQFGNLLRAQPSVLTREAVEYGFFDFHIDDFVSQTI